MDTVILGIESSCDDTSAAVLKNGKILANLTANQTVHKAYGGVVPELASRAHLRNIIPVTDQVMKQANIERKDLTAIAFTRGPGLLGSLLVGASFARSLAQGLGIPALGVHHMKAHILAHFIDAPKPSFPFLCLTVSGGHTQLVRVDDYNEMEILGQTIDDAAGEAFDKSAKILGLEYPGGPLIDKLAEKGNPLAFKFAEPRVGELEFSFSGLKTSILYFVRDMEAKEPGFVQKNLNDLAASIQHSIVNILLKKISSAALVTKIKEVGIAGGVSANSVLRRKMLEQGAEQGWNVYIPEFQYCTDNAAMVAMAAYYRLQGGPIDAEELKVKARIPLN